jgi:uncharacterized protein (DUF2236 family)
MSGEPVKAFDDAALYGAPTAPSPLRRAYVRGAWDAMVNRGFKHDTIAEVFRDIGVTVEEAAALSVEIHQERKKR